MLGSCILVRYICHPLVQVTSGQARTHGRRVQTRPRGGRVQTRAHGRRAQTRAHGRRAQTRALGRRAQTRAHGRCAQLQACSYQNTWVRTSKCQAQNACIHTRTHTHLCESMCSRAHVRLHACTLQSRNRGRHTRATQALCARCCAPLYRPAPSAGQCMCVYVCAHVRECGCGCAHG